MTVHASILLAAVLLGSSSPEENRCLDCHRGIEAMHAVFPLTCVECHGGNATAATKEAAHPGSIRSIPNDERVLPMNYDIALLRFRNPTDLRVAKDVCGRCHSKEVEDLSKSLHGTTAGHLSDGYYEYGLVDDRESRFGIFPVADVDGDVPKERGAIARVGRLPDASVPKGSKDIRDHYRDLPRKACMRCHLYSEGTGLRGRLGQGGDYRAQGCAACHVTYADDGLSRSADPTVDRYEPGHPVRHEMTRRVPTESCTRCHNGDASIGLNFRGLAQTVPGMPAGPDVPGTTATRLHGTFHVSDPATTPPDVHHERGMHCVDCHTVRDVMGDGNSYGKMEHAVEIECESCHGAFDAAATLRTERGNPLQNLRREGDRVVLRSKVTGREHRVKQARDVVTPSHADFNPRAAAAMTPEHARLRCYACHNAWNPLFFGFHFDRNESFTQLDTLSGERTEGRVSTLEKVFGTYRGVVLGLDPGGRVAPFLVGFAAMATVRDRKGEIVVDQGMPVTRAGLSGMTLVHHQMHTNRAAARACAECHLSPQAAGLGSGLFELTRRHAVAAHETGVTVFRYERANPAASLPVGTVPVAGAVAAALRSDPLTGSAETAYVAGKAPGLVAIDVSSPEKPKKIASLSVTDPKGLLLDGDRLYLADGAGGVRLYDTGRGRKPVPLGAVATTDATALAIAWPRLFVADGAGGLRVVDVSDPEKPAVVSSVETRALASPSRARGVAVLFQPARPDPSGRGRSEARLVAFVSDAGGPVVALDVSQSDAPRPLARVPFGGFDSQPGFEPGPLAVFATVDLGSDRGRIPSEERDYLVAAFEVGPPGARVGYVRVVDVSDPARPRPVSTPNVPAGIAGVTAGHVYEPPFVRTLLFVGSAAGPAVYDLSKPALPSGLVLVPGLARCGPVALESFSFDRLVEPHGAPRKDVSHPGARYLGAAEIERLLLSPLRRAGEGNGR